MRKRRTSLAIFCPPAKEFRPISKKLPNGFTWVHGAAMDAQFNIAAMYQNGRGVELSLTKLPNGIGKLPSKDTRVPKPS